MWVGSTQQKCDHTLDLKIDGTMHKYNIYTPLRRLKIYFNVQVLYITLDALFAALAWGLMETPQVNYFIPLAILYCMYLAALKL